VLRVAAGFLVFACVFVRWIGSRTTADGTMSVAGSAGPIVGGRVTADREAVAGRLDVRKP
jgi:hypothetical protein